MSVTAVPLHPLPKGTVLKLWIGILAVMAIGAGLAWLGTSGLQYTTTESGLRYRVIEEGTGDKVTPDDLIQLDYEIRRPDGTILESTQRNGRPVEVTVNTFIPGLRELMLELRKGGLYQAFITAERAVGQPIPAGAPVAGSDLLEFNLRVGNVLKGMGAMQEMMGPGGGGPGGPGGPMPGGPGGPMPGGPGGPMPGGPGGPMPSGPMPGGSGGGPPMPAGPGGR